MHVHLTLQKWSYW